MGDGWKKGEGPYSKSPPKLNPYTGMSGEQDGGGPASRGKNREGLVDTNAGVNNGYSDALNGKY